MQIAINNVISDAFIYDITYVKLIKYINSIIELLVLGVYGWSQHTANIILFFQQMSVSTLCYYLLTFKKDWNV